MEDNKDAIRKEAYRIVNNILKDPKKLTPCVLIGGSLVSTFKRCFKGTIETIYSIDDVRRVVDEYDGIESVNSGILALVGVGALYETGQNSLLKFIEEAKLPIVILSSNDRVSPIIMSRVKFTYKLVNPIEDMKFEHMKSGLNRVEQALEDVRDKSLADKELAEVYAMVDYCPELFGVYYSSRERQDRMNFINKKILNTFVNADRAINAER